MKTKKIMRRLMGCAAAILALSACSESEDLLAAYHSDSKAVHITAQVGKASADGFTRSNPLGTAEEQAKFNENDEISVKADGQDAVTYKLVGSEWQPKGNKFLKWEKETMNFTAYYPATYTGGTIEQPTAYPDEASLIAADYMSYTGDVNNPGDNSLKLTMNRLMARVVVDVVGFNDQYDKNTPINSVSICGVTAYKHKDDGKFYALIKPAEAQSTSEFLSLEVGDNKVKETLTGIPTLEAGKSYTYELTVGKNKISVSGITVKDWTTGMTITGGKAEYFPYVTFKANAAQTFKMTVKTEKGNYTFPSLEYSVNNGKWTTVVAGTEVPFGGANGDLRLRGTGNTNGTSSAVPNDDESYVRSYDYSYINFSTNEEVECEGDIRTLLDYKTYKTVNTNNARFYNLFSRCQQLISAPDLPATNLASSCYDRMFYLCTNLKKTPDLPATTLASDCYSHMFYGCTNLDTAPDLPATTLASDCYFNMFGWCTNLKIAPKLPATTLVNECYFYMFNRCTNLNTAPVLLATTLALSCYSYMFYECTNLTSVTMLAPSDKISNTGWCCDRWLDGAGTKEGITRTLKVKDEAAYNALVDKGYLPDIWKKGPAGATVLDENSNKIE